MASTTRLSATSRSTSSRSSRGSVMLKSRRPDEIIPERPGHLGDVKGGGRARYVLVFPARVGAHLWECCATRLYRDASRRLLLLAIEQLIERVATADRCLP